jgi:hypothetical protein
VSRWQLTNSYSGFLEGVLKKQTNRRVIMMHIKQQPGKKLLVSRFSLVCLIGSGLALAEIEIRPE